MRKIIYVSGGQRSGKSSFAQSMAENMSDNPTYLATARCWDDEFRERISRHQSDRGEQWDNLEEEVEISNLSLTGKVVLMDCVTLWLTNIFTDNNLDRNKSLEIAKDQWSKFMSQDFTLIVVSNEIGLGVIPIESSTRAFVDLQGWMNQYIAKSADEAYTLISGIPLRIK